MTMLSPCAADYAVAICDPFDCKPTCVPTTPAILSQKLKYRAVGTFTSGTTGFGFVSFDPFKGVASNGDAVIASTNNATFVSNAFADTTATAGTSYFQTNATLALANFALGAANSQFRIVSAGLRVRYRGTQQFKNGSVYAVSEPSHDTLAAQTTAGVALMPWASVVPVSRDWITCVWLPYYPTDYGFNVDSSTSNRCLAIGVSVDSTVTGGSLFDWEVAVNVEISGRSIPGMTPSTPDPVGLGSVSAAAQGPLLATPYSGDPLPVVNQFIRGVRMAVNDFTTRAGYAAGAYVGNRMMGMYSSGGHTAQSLQLN